MAPLPANNTHRAFFDYVTGNSTTSREHTVAVRYDPARVDVADVQTRFLAVLQALTAANFRQGWRVIRVRIQAAGTNFSTPVSVISGLASFLGTATTPTYNARVEAVEWTMQGRSVSTGRRVDISLYTALADATGNFRYTAADLSQVTATITALNTQSAAGAFLTIDGTAANWYAYFNANYNSYWESRSRTA